MDNATATDVVTVITILKNLLVSGIQVDRETRAKISTMSDEEVVALSRSLIADTDKKASEFLGRLEGEDDPQSE